MASANATSPARVRRLEIDRDGYVMYSEPIHLVPPQLADFECKHGKIRSCEDCAAERTPHPVNPDELTWR